MLGRQWSVVVEVVCGLYEDSSLASIPSCNELRLELKAIKMLMFCCFENDGQQAIFLYAAETG